ncbi:MAG: Hsp20/alpha crystallin family protein [Halanaerobiales bacterium]|nr:Hsp20/alpha crystallin family protein [Halanaerobiales bacterium]
MSNNPFDQMGIEFPDLEKYIKQVLNQTMNKANSSFTPVDKSNLKDFIQNVLNQSFDFNSKNYHSMHTSPKTEFPEPIFFEIHGFTIVRLEIPAGINQRNIKVFLKGNQVIINWTPDQREQTFQLTTNVSPKNTKAIVKDNVLELRLPSDPEIETNEISIQFL